MIGNNSTKNVNGVKLRRGTKVKIYNTLVTGKSKALVIESAETQASLVDGESILNNVYISGALTAAGNYTTELFTATANGNKIDQTFDFTSKYKGTVDGGKDISSDSFFSSTNYIGAVATTNDWTIEWSR